MTNAHPHRPSVRSTATAFGLIALALAGMYIGFNHHYSAQSHQSTVVLIGLSCIPSVAGNLILTRPDQRRTLWTLTPARRAAQLVASIVAWSVIAPLIGTYAIARF